MIGRPADGRRRRPALVLLALLAAVVVTPAAAALPAGSPLAAPIAAAASSGLTVTADARYVVDPGKHRVHVTVGLAATNHRTDTKTHRFFFDRTFLAVQPATTGYRVASAGAKPSVHVSRRTATYVLLEVDFGAHLAAGASRTFSLSFDLSDPGGAPTRTTRIGSSLVSFGVWGFGNAGTPGGSVSVVFPPGFSISVDAPEFSAPTSDAAGNVTYATGRLATPLTFFAFFVADRPGAYKETILPVVIGGQSIPITIRAWPDDPAWATRVGGLLQRGLPALAADIGLPWTVDQPLVVSEATSRTSAGFSGRYNPPAGQIEIAYYASPFVVLHEAAHAWFDGSLLADRWASEGFASYYALRAAAAIGEKHVTGDALTPALEAARIPLNAWSAPGTASKIVEDAEYATALSLATQIATRAGPDGLRAVWRAIHERRAAYQPVGPTASLETATDAPDWRGLLDLLEDRTPNTYDDLWTSFVVRPSDAPLLAARATARRAYDSLASRAVPWTLPRVVRDALRAWQFDQVAELESGASRALDQRDAVHAAATDAGLAPPPLMEVDFEGPRGFTASVAEGDAELSAIAAYRTAAASRSAEPDPLARIGLWNNEPLAALNGAAGSFTAGDLATSVSLSAYAHQVWATAADVGRNRVLAAGASLAAIVVGLWLVRRWRRDRAIRPRRPAHAHRT